MNCKLIYARHIGRHKKIERENEIVLLDRKWERYIHLCRDTQCEVCLSKKEKDRNKKVRE